MNDIVIKLKNYIHTNKKAIQTKMFIVVLALTTLLVGIYQLNSWSAKNRFQKPWYYNLELYGRPLVIAREPLTVLSPFVEEAMEADIDISALSSIEKKLFDTFGVRWFDEMRAIAVCESNMNPLAVNWGSKDIGLMQVNLPSWEKAIAEKFGYTIADLFDVDKNIEVAYWIWDRADGVEGDNKGGIDPWVASRTSCFSKEL